MNFSWNIITTEH